VREFTLSEPASIITWATGQKQREEEEEKKEEEINKEKNKKLEEKYDEGGKGIQGEEDAITVFVTSTILLFRKPSLHRKLPFY
jgi:hypothetical protein